MTAPAGELHVPGVHKGQTGVVRAELRIDRVGRGRGEGVPPKLVEVRRLGALRPILRDK
jgi:hypothetical protein